MAALIWDRLAQGWANMAERFEELICNFDTGESTMEVTTVLLVGWAIFCVLLVALGRYVNQRFLQPHSQDAKEGESAPAPATATAPAPSKGAKPKTADVSDVAPVRTAAAPRPAGGSGGGGGGGGSRGPSAPVAVPQPRRRSTSSQAKEPLIGAASFAPLSKSSPIGAAVPKPAGAPPPVVLRDVANLPFATGAEQDAVRWVNSVIEWIFTDPTPTPDLHATWLTGLNQVSQTLASENGIQLLFQEITPDSELPIMTNVMADPGPGENVVNILSDIESTVLVFILQATRQMGENFWSTEYTCIVDSLSGPLSVACDVSKLVGTVHFDCRPRIRLTLIPNPRTKLSDPVDEQALQAVVSEVVCGAITHTAVDLLMEKFAGCPRYLKSKVVAEPVLPVHYDSMIPTGQAMAPVKKLVKKGRRLLVKVVKANNLGSDKGCSSPYCIVELDEPSQKHATGPTEGPNPFWDEHFLFDLSNETGEILFEIWDKPPQQGKAERFVGLGIVSVDDLLRNPSQRQILSLQSRPYEGDDVSGSLTVEFVCMESADVPTQRAVEKPVPRASAASVRQAAPPPPAPVPVPSSAAEKARPPRPPPPSPVRLVDSSRTVGPGGTVVTTTTTFRKPLEGPPAIIVNGEDTVTSTALRELARPKPDRPPAITTDRSTLIIHSVQRPDGTETGRMVESTTNLEDHDPERSRPKERKSFMNTLRKRLSFRGKRSRSVDQNQDANSRDSSGSRSSSVDRPHSMPGSREGSYPSSGGSHADNLSARSSLSEMSGVSGASSQTYIDEASMLVIECLENGIVKHYLVPSALGNKSKWRKRGIKLHIYNDHTFVAKHLASNAMCQVCNKPFIRRIGKQGYECRDCQLTCHKPCHVRTDTHCPSGRVGSMELEYVQEGKNERSK